MWSSVRGDGRWCRHGGQAPGWMRVGRRVSTNGEGIGVSAGETAAAIVAVVGAPLLGVILIWDLRGRRRASAGRRR